MKKEVPIAITRYKPILAPSTRRHLIETPWLEFASWGCPFCDGWFRSPHECLEHIGGQHGHLDGAKDLLRTYATMETEE